MDKGLKYLIVRGVAEITKTDAIITSFTKFLNLDYFINMVF